jgi:hypothetical protein
MRVLKWDKKDKIFLLNAPSRVCSGDFSPTEIGFDFQTLLATKSLKTTHPQ